jgi:hypothetical protein
MSNVSGRLEVRDRGALVFAMAIYGSSCQNLYPCCTAASVRAVMIFAPIQYSACCPQALQTPAYYGPLEDNANVQQKVLGKQLKAWNDTMSRIRTSL